MQGQWSPTSFEPADPGGPVLIRVLVDENIPVPDITFLEGLELIKCSGRDIKPADLEGVDALLVRSVTRVDSLLLEGSGVRFVGSATAGFDHLDTDYLNQACVEHFHAAGSNAQSVVDYVLCCLAALGVDPREGRVGILGCGQVGGLLYKRLQKLQIECRCYDPFLTATDQADLADLEQAVQSDILCLHTPLTTDGPYPTENMLGYAELSLLPKDSVVINAGRGGVINEAALKKLKSGRPDVRLVMDVWENEPDIDEGLIDLCEIVTPHIAGYSAAAKQRGSQMVFGELFKYFGIESPTSAKGQAKPEMLLGDCQWDRALLSVYDPRKDDKRLRSNARSFDQLRKSYPLRAEVAEFSAKDRNLQNFGFSQL